MSVCRCGYPYPPRRHRHTPAGRDTGLAWLLARRPDLRRWARLGDVLDVAARWAA